MRENKVNRVLIIHGIFLLIITLANSIGLLIGYKTGKGLFSFVQTYPIAGVGLIQAYPLMLLLGVSLLMNIRSKSSWKYDLLAAIAHVIPLLALMTFWDIIIHIMGYETAILSTSIHVPWIIIELLAARYYYQKQNIHDI